MKAPLETLGLENEYDVLVNAHGGVVTGQADAIRLGVARALCELAPENRKPLKVEGYMILVVKSVRSMVLRKLVKLLNTRNGNVSFKIHKIKGTQRVPFILWILTFNTAI